MAMSAEDSRDLELTPPGEFPPQLVESSTFEQQQEGQCKRSFSKNIISSPASDEPCTQEVEENGTQAQPLDCHHSRGSLMGSSLEKLSSPEDSNVSITAAEDRTEAVSPFLELDNWR